MFAALVHVGLVIGLAAITATPPAAPPAGDKPEGKMAITDKPLTVKIEPSEQLRLDLAAAIKPAAKVSIRLTLHGVVPPERRDLTEGIRVFLNKDDATRTTPIDDPHYVSSIVFAATNERDPQGFHMDLTRTVAELTRQGKLDLAKPLRITLIGVPAEGLKDLPPAFSVPVAKVSITADAVRK